MATRKFNAKIVLDVVSDVSDSSDNNDRSDFDITMVVSDSETDHSKEYNDDSANDQTDNNSPGAPAGWRR